MKFLVHTSRMKNSEKKIEVGRRIDRSKHEKQKEKWMSYEKLEIEFGLEKAKHWVNSGKLQSRPDSVTGSDDPMFREYRIKEDTAVITP